MTPPNIFSTLSWFMSYCAILLMPIALSGCGGSGNGSGGVDGKFITANISGTLSYQDREYGRYGFTGNTAYKPIRYAVVDLVDSDNQLIDSDVSNDAGQYTLSGSGAGLRVRILAQSASTVGAVVTVANHSGSAYAVAQQLESEELEQVLDIQVSVSSDVGGAFNILDAYVAATQRLMELSNTPLPALNVYWQAKSSRYGTYYCPGTGKGGPCPQGRGIYLLGGSSTGGDTDEYDDDVLWHEYGHYIETAKGVHDSPGGTHYLTDNDRDLRLTWSEGFGSFFPHSVKSWLIANNSNVISTASGLATSYFIDTYSTIAAISIEMGNPNPLYCPGGKDCFIYSSSEVAVVKVLVDMHDEFGMQAVWDAYTGYMATGTSNPATLEAFWDGWIAQRSPTAGELTTMQDIFNNRKVYYQHDSFENDNSSAPSRKLTVCSDDDCDGEVHYLYSQQTSTDVDVTAFDVTAGLSYFIETYDLSNGADTYMRILDGSGNVVMNGSGQQLANDDRPGTVYCYSGDNPCRVHNDELMLSSELTFTPSSSGTYYIEVKTSSNRASASGRYGSYKLRAVLQ